MIVKIDFQIFFENNLNNIRLIVTQHFIYKHKNLKTNIGKTFF